ncbi:rod shape-determining protein RodA [Allosphingosinicella deserti]|uniref:Peptidoglycan glycosyltransferase MrdB n=1 Tax=Allosphingosinicella deserti TaxID=2116704 RepID=A0A2P7QHF1_9SPHN|nr:rod shape-determining protein RodA [Sphingomonas deserti]PSJ37412.1 rod shape-determining protein RodA [Sphingomonas deserti]
MRGASFVPAPVATLPWGMLWIVLALGAAGVLALYSAAGGSFSPWAAFHAVRFTAFFCMALVISRFRTETFHDLTFVAYAGGICLLILTLMLGVIGGGARSWLELGFVRLQPSELMKPIIVLVIARFYARMPPKEIRRWAAIWPVGVFLGPPILLILLQPDLGTTMLIVLNTIALMFLAGLPLRLFIGSGIIVGAALPLVYSFLLLPHQQKRVLIFLDPEADPLGAGYHLTQSKIAIGSGGLFGKGFLNGTQSHLEYLPEQHTDFIFSAIAEEWGLVGGCVLIALFFLLVRWGMNVAIESKGRFERLTAAGLTLTIFFYLAINLMMVMGLAPVVGIPLPLVSYGGSAMLTVMICLGMLMAIDRGNKKDRRN